MRSGSPSAQDPNLLMICRSVRARARRGHSCRCRSAISATVTTRRPRLAGVVGRGSGVVGRLRESAAIVAYVPHWTASATVAMKCVVVVHTRCSSPPRNAATVAESSGRCSTSHNTRRGDNPPSHLDTCSEQGDTHVLR